MAYIGWPKKGFSGQQIILYARSQSEGKAQLERLADLTDADIYGFKYGERERDPLNPALTYRYDVQVFPKFCTVTSQKREVDRAKGRGQLTGNWSSLRERIELWAAEEPIGTRELLTQMAQWHTPLRFG
jgi:hypothetical protein